MRSYSFSQGPSILDSLGSDAGKAPKGRMMAIVALTSFLTTMPEYFFSVVNVAEGVFRRFDNQTFYERYGVRLDKEATLAFSGMVTAFNVGTILGSLSSSLFAERFGRRLSMMVMDNVGLIVGGLLCGLAQAADSFAMLVAGRVVVGYFTGLAYVMLALYLTEISRPQQRGFNASFQNLMVSFNGLVSMALALPILLGRWQLWIPLNMLPVPFAFLQLLLTPFFPETPKFLYLKRKDEVGARKAFLFFNPQASDIEVAETFYHYDQEAKLETTESVHLGTAWRTYHLRQPLILSFLVALSSVATGITVIFGFSTELFEKAGLGPETAQWGTVMMGASNVLGSVFAIPLMDRMGRRALLLGGIFTTTLCLIIFAGSQLLNHHGLVAGPWPGYIGVAAVMVHVLVYNMGPGAIQWFISSEMTPQTARSLGATITVTASGAVQVLINFAFPPLESFVGPWAYLTLIVPSVLVAAYLYLRLPETANRNVHEVIQEWILEDDRQHLVQ